MELYTNPFRKPNPGESGRRVTISFTEDQYRGLEVLSQRKEKSMGQTVRDALFLELIAQTIISEGGSICIIESDGTRKKVWIRG